MNIYMLIDRSASMGVRWDEVMSSINAYVDELTKKKVVKKSKITIAVFDFMNGELSFDIVRRNIRAKEWEPIGYREFPPRGQTPLYDAIEHFVTVINKDNPKKSTVAIMTDGHENASRTTTMADAKAMLDKLREKDYDVVFLGADFDVRKQAHTMGGASGQSLNVTTGNYSDAMKAMAGRTASYSSDGKVRSFSDEERARAAGK